VPQLLQALAGYLLVWAYLGSAASANGAVEQALIEGGRFEPMYPAAESERATRVPAFRLDKRPVTNAEFLSFVLLHPNWRRDRVSALFAEQRYLAQWASASELGALAPAQAPVVLVSWFAARAYCQARGARLPSELEWEYAAAASETSRDARQDPAFIARILGWYGKPSGGVLPRVGFGQPNSWGVYDLHGLVWEWVEDFNGGLISADSRNTKDADKQAFCGASASSARDVANYAAFMRVAFLSSLTARDVTQSLGFRCASDAKEAS